MSRTTENNANAVQSVVWSKTLPPIAYIYHYKGKTWVEPIKPEAKEAENEHTSNLTRRG